MTVAQKMTQWAGANGVGELQAATIDARSRLNDSSIGTQVETGKFRVVRTIYGKRKPPSHRFQAGSPFRMPFRF